MIVIIVLSGIAATLYTSQPVKDPPATSPISNSSTSAGGGGSTSRGQMRDIAIGTDDDLWTEDTGLNEERLERLLTEGVRRVERSVGTGTGTGVGVGAGVGERVLERSLGIEKERRRREEVDVDRI